MSTGRVGIAIAAAALGIAALPPASAVAPPASLVAAPGTLGRDVTAVTRAWRALAPPTVVVGSSVQGRKIVAIRQGAAAAPYVLLVVGQMHGSEPRGRDVVAEVRRIAPPGGVQVWTITTMNPDGARAGTRRNARGVDLNRNFPNRWRPSYTRQIYFPGRRAGSEPETRAMIAFLDRLRPDLVVSLHQAYRSVDIGNVKTGAWAVRLGRALGLPTLEVPCRGLCSGTMTGWFNAVYRGSAVTVELPARVSPPQARAYARGTIRVAAALRPATRVPTGPAPPVPPMAPPTPTPSDTPTPTPTTDPSLTPDPSSSPSGSTTPTDTPVVAGPSATAPSP